MGKKMLFAIIAAMVVTGSVFAQKVSVAVNAVPLVKGFMVTNDVISAFGIGLNGEIKIASNYSLGVRLDLFTGKQSGSLGTASETYFGITANGRWYPLSETLEKFFMEAAFGFNTDKIKNAPNAQFTGIVFGLKAGWKHMFENSKIFAEPGIGYVLSKSGAMSIPTPLGWQIAFNIGMVF
ncbi:hypothetical protein AGMMS50230_11630 [Spirochaetia bacterium]|nr:hypothetical protein AGMMS50230_11630 [Spirochaetia bacterium]